jgi:hypothetical protein
MAAPDCDCVVLPVCYRGEISSLGNAEALQCARAPNGGQCWRKVGDHHVKRGFLQSRIKTIDINRGMPAKSLYFDNLYYFFRDITE